MRFSVSPKGDREYAKNVALPGNKVNVARCAEMVGIDAARDDLTVNSGPMQLNICYK
jgi:hypothetical protein